MSVCASDELVIVCVCPCPPPVEFRFIVCECEPPDDVSPDHVLEAAKDAVVAVGIVPVLIKGPLDIADLVIVHGDRACNLHRAASVRMRARSR